MAKIQQEIQQKQPTTSLEEEAMLNLLRTSDCLSRAVQRTIRAWGITSTQYNVLRICEARSRQAQRAARLANA